MLVTWNRQQRMTLSGFIRKTLPDGSVRAIWARGYFFDASRRMYLDREIVDWLAGQLATRQLLELAPSMNGCFVLAVAHPDTTTVEVVTDRYGSVPVYVGLGDSAVALSDCYWDVVGRLQQIQYDAIAAFAMVFLGYVTGCRTLVEKAIELPQGAIHRIACGDRGPHLSSVQYWSYASRPGPVLSREKWVDSLADVLDCVFARYARDLGARDCRVQVPLSGGIDSRVVVGMLHRYGASVEAFSYGPPGNPESRSAAGVAEVLGIPFQFVSIDDTSHLKTSLVTKMTKRIGMKARFTVGLGGQIASGVLPDPMVCISGHPGNFPAGVFERGTNLVRTEKQALEHLMNNMALPVFDEMAASVFPGIWRTNLKTEVMSEGWDFQVNDPMGSYERWHLDFHVRRLLLSEMRTYEAFGRWMLPYLDHELFDTYTGMPPEYRYRRKLHLEALLRRVLVGDLEALADIPLADGEAPRPTRLRWQDQVLMRVPPSLAGDWILDRATAAKRREHRASIGQSDVAPLGPDPLDYWWYNDRGFRRTVRGIIAGWDGMEGIIDVDAVRRVLRQPLPRLFVRFAVPGLLTLRYFQQIVEDEF